MTTPHIQSNEEEHWKYTLNKLLKAVSRDDTGSFKDVEDWHSQQIATAVEKERKRCLQIVREAGRPHYTRDYCERDFM